MAEEDQSLGGALGSAWNAVKNFFAEIPSHMPCIPCMFKKAAAAPAPNVGPNWTKAVNDVFPGQQSYQNCGLQSSRQVIDQAKGKLGKSELQFMDDAIASCGVDRAANHPADSGASTAVSRQCVMKQYGVPSSVEPATVANVDAALRDRKGIIMSSSSDVLWSTQGIAQGAGGGGLHAVVITNGLYDTDGKMTGVHINDTGTGTQYTLTTAQLKDCLDSGSGKLNVTDVPIWPNN
ncbi:MAG TPA: hypothetical protein VF457_00100 [Burkholderiaceae bacterium]